MILIEQTHWPVVVVGAVPAASAPPAPPEGRLWASEDLQLVVVIPGDHARGWIAQAEVFAWIATHRERLWRCASRVAWVFEDERMCRNAERWLTLVGDRLFRGDVMTFLSVRAAITWLTHEALSPGDLR